MNIRQYHCNSLHCGRQWKLVNNDISNPSFRLIHNWCVSICSRNDAVRKSTGILLRASRTDDILSVPSTHTGIDDEGVWNAPPRISLGTETDGTLHSAVSVGAHTSWRLAAVKSGPRYGQSGQHYRRLSRTESDTISGDPGTSSSHLHHAEQASLSIT